MSTFQKLGNSNNVGANTEQLKKFGALLKTESASKIDELIKKVNSEMGQTAWAGGDADDFESGWQKVQAELKKVTQLFEEFGQLAEKQAQQQDQVSAKGN
jgi:ribosomal protein L12E/L44/L45/RPP1/RPP2